MATQGPPSHSASEPELPAGTVLADRYRIDALLGEGGMGKVYAGEHVLLRKRVAIKVLHGDRALVPEVVARFEREAMAAANIGHPNIAEASDFGRLPDGGVFLVLEYVQGRNLRDVVADGPLPLRESLHVARQVATALAAAQALQIVHRDLKPENVMLIEKAGDPSFVKVLDFGIARVPMADSATQPLTKAGTIFGTPEYMAPEQALGQKADGRADLYSLGVMLFEMLAGVRPYDGAGTLARQIAAPIPTLRERAPEASVPADVEELVRRLLARTASSRPQTAAEVIEALDALIERHGRPGGSAAPAAPLVRAAPNAAPAPRVGTFLPGDPLPAFELPETTAAEGPAPASAVPAAANAARAEAPEPATLLRAPRVDVGSTARAEPEAPEPLPVRSPGAVSRFAATVGSRSIAAYRRAAAFVDAHRDVLPNPIRRRLRRVSAGAIVGLAIGLTLVGIFVLLALARCWRGDQEAPPAPAPATRVEAPPAPGGGAPETAVAPSVAPADPKALVTRAEVDLEARRDGSAVALVERALTQDPALKDDERTSAVLARAARSEDAAARDRAFALLTSRMGQKGADAVYDLSLDARAPEAARRSASSWLTTKDFDRASSPALYAAVRLRLAPTCAQKAGMLKLAANVGGRQALDYLRELDRCEPRASAACSPCLRAEGRLAETIRMIEKRLATPAPP